MNGRPKGWWAWHALGAAVGLVIAGALTRDPWVVAFTAAASVGWSAGRHRLAPWLGAVMNVLYGVVLSVGWFLVRHRGGAG
jgi:4-hydroxybenzoate polyprenyltransferase